MPVNLSDIRTFAADSVRVQRLQELQQLASRTNQAQLATEFDRALDLRRATVKETDETENPIIQGEDDPRNPGGSSSQSDGDAGSPEDQGSTPAATASIDGIGENIDLRG